MEEHDDGRRLGRWDGGGDRRVDLGRQARHSTIRVIHALELAAAVIITAAGSFLAAKLTH